MTWSISHVAPQTERVADITGAKSGIGFDSAKILAPIGMTVILARRNTDKAKVTKGE